jgi:hypothetical protein
VKTVGVKIWLKANYYEEFDYLSRNTIFYNK